MRILFILLDQRIAGPQNRVLQLVRSLNKRNFQPIIVLPKGGGDCTEILKDLNIPFYEMNLNRMRATFNPFKQFLWLCSLFRSVVELKEFVQTNNIDILYANSLMHIHGPLAAKLASIKLVWFLNDIPPLLLRLLLGFLLWMLPDIIIVNAKVLAKKHFIENKMLSKRIHTIYSPVDINKFNPNAKREKIRKEFQIEPEIKLIGTVGNINPWKGYEYFVEAANLIKSRFQNTKFLIVGAKLDTQKDYFERLEGLIKKFNLEQDVIFTGRRLDMPDVMSDIDIFVLSSISESCPLVLLEAMASGKPTVATMVGGVPELVENGETGIIVRPKDSAAIADAVSYLLCNPQEAVKTGKKGRQRAVHLFSLEEHVRNNEKIFKQLRENP